MRLMALLFGGMAVLCVIVACGALEKADRFFRRSGTPAEQAGRRARHHSTRWLFAVLAVLAIWQCVESFRLAAQWE